MNYFDVVVIGGGPAGLSVGEALIKKHKDKKVAVIREEETNFVPCGMPYIFGKFNFDIDKDVKPTGGFVKDGGNLIVDMVTKINRKEKTVLTKSNELYSYDKLIVATGSKPLVPTFIKGYDNPNVHYIAKSYRYTKEMVAKIRDAKRIAVIGGGFIGLETADELASDTNKKITVVEMQEHVLSLAFTKSMSVKAENALQDRGINILANTRLVEVKQEGDDTVLVFSDDSTLAVDAVIFALGYRANSQLAVDADIPTNQYGNIIVDTFLRTVDEDIVAIGDCAQKKDFITRKDCNAMLASVAGAESRFVSENLFKLESVRNSIGTIKIFSTVLNEQTFAVAGVTEDEAKKEKMDVIIGQAVQKDKHPGTLPDVSDVSVRLTIMAKTHYIIGAEISGGNSVGEMINVIGTAIQAKLNIWDFYTFQTGSQPMLTAGPTVNPLMKAVENAIRQIN